MCYRPQGSSCKAASRLEDLVRIERRSLPPSVLIRHFEDCKVQVRCVGRSIPCRPDVRDHISPRDRLAVVNIARIMIKVRVVVAEALCWIELINGVATGLAHEQFGDRA